MLKVFQSSFKSSGKSSGKGNAGKLGANGAPNPGIAGKLGPSGSLILIWWHYLLIYHYYDWPGSFGSLGPIFPSTFKAHSISLTKLSVAIAITSSSFSMSALSKSW